MKTYPMESIRNVALIAPHGVGKTALADAMLHVTGKVGRRGDVDDGSSVFDYHEDEIERKQTISASLAWTEIDDTKINIIDTPGVADFRGDVFASLAVIEGALFVVKADGGLEVASESLWQLVRKAAMPSFIVLNRMNKEHAKFAESVAGIQERLEGTAVPVQLPIGSGEGLTGVVDLIGMQAWQFADGKGTKIDIPADMADEVEEAREELLNAAAETDDDLVEKFLEDGTLNAEDMLTGLRNGIADGSVYPIFLTAADTEVGVKLLLESIANMMPGAHTRDELKGFEPGTEDEATLTPAADGATVAYAFKRQSEAQGGELTWVRIMSGSVKSGDTLTNSGTDNSERIGQLNFVVGRTRDKVDAVAAGDIAVVAKLKSTSTGTTLYDSAANFALPPILFPTPTSYEAIFPATAGDEDKMGTGLNRMHEEDPTFTVRHEADLHQTLLIGQGEMHVTYILQKLKKNFGVEVERKRPRVAFRETIRGKTEMQGRYKKQTGGRGQFGDVHLRFEPAVRGEGFEFLNEIVGGVVPGKFIPAVEKGVVETFTNGVIAGYPVVDMKVALFFGSFHNVDSSENSFKSAARVAIRNAFEQKVGELRPVILEPIMLVTITVPQSYMGDVMGDVSTRRGQIQGSDADGAFQVVKANIPEDELYQYSTALRSMTQGTGTFAMEFSHYAEVPGDVQKRLVKEYEATRTDSSD